MSAAPLDIDELRFINLVAARRFGHDAAASSALPDVEVGNEPDERPARRAAELAAALARPGAVAAAALPTALLAVICQLDRDGYRLVAPQGVAAGMIQGLRTGAVSVAAFAVWVEDRAIDN
jgi:hypothetical protein